MTRADHLLAIDRLLAIMDRLRAPGGCPWDAEQTPESLIPYLLEEAHETIEAIELGDPAEIRDELGDLLLQVVFHSRIFAERGDFTIGDVATAIGDKLIRRHPHVFNRDSHDDAADLTTQWERIKSAEKSRKGAAPQKLEESLPRSLPALHRAQKLVEKSSRHGRCWPDADATAAALPCQLTGLMAAPSDQALGDLLFSLVLLARHQGLDAEGALRRATGRAMAREEH